MWPPRAMRVSWRRFSSMSRRKDGGTSGKQEKKTSNRKCKRRQTQSDESKTKIKTYDNHGFVSKTNSSEKGETTTTLCNPTAEVSTFCEKTSPNRWTDHRRTTDWWSSYLQWSTQWSVLWWRSQSYSVIGGKCPACHTSDRDHQLATSLDHNIAWNPPQGGSRSNKVISCSTISMILNLSCTLCDFFFKWLLKECQQCSPKDGDWRNQPRLDFHQHYQAPEHRQLQSMLPVCTLCRPFFTQTALHNALLVAQSDAMPSGALVQWWDIPISLTQSAVQHVTLCYCTTDEVLTIGFNSSQKNYTFSPFLDYDPERSICPPHIYKKFTIW